MVRTFVVTLNIAPESESAVQEGLNKNSGDGTLSSYLQGIVETLINDDLLEEGWIDVDVRECDN